MGQAVGYLWRGSGSYRMRCRQVVERRVGLLLFQRGVLNYPHVPSHYESVTVFLERLCDPVARVTGYRSTCQGSIPGATSNGSEPGPTQPREYN
jgi:hypothetical protein